MEAAESRLREKDQVIAMLNNRCEAYKEDAEAYGKLYESADGRTDAYKELIEQKEKYVYSLLDTIELLQREINSLKAQTSGIKAMP